MNPFPHLLSPLQISHPSGSMTIRNRVLVSAHVPGFAENNKAGDAYINYHRQYAANGVGLQLTGGTPVHRSGLLATTADGLWNLDDGIIPGYQKLAEAVHQEGGHILAQLAHSGGTVRIDLPGHQSWSASAIKSAITGQVSHAMTESEIHEVIEAHAAAARRVRQGGLDGVEILAAFGFLPQAFLSPLTNFREDQYGGNLDNRMRFLVSLLSAVRSELGPEQILGVRLPGDEFEPGGLDSEQMAKVCTELAEAGLIDYLNIIAHTNFSHTGRSKHWAPTPAPHGLFVPLASAIRKQVSVPVFAAGRIINPEHAEQIVAEGDADMVAMTRAHICDPEIVKKIKAGQTEYIRPCVGANTCIANRYAGKQIRCMHNPSVRMPGFTSRASSKPQRVAVIGAGPAGLEAARLLAAKKHEVTVYEAQEQVGGQLRLWASSNSMGELRRIIDWRIGELHRLGVNIKLSCCVTPKHIEQLGADCIVVCTGSVQKTRHSAGFAGNAIQYLTPAEVMQATDLTGNKALVINDGRGQAGLVAAEKLLAAGMALEIVTSDYAVAADLDPTNRNAWYERLGKAGALLTPQQEVTEIIGTTVKLKNVFTQQSSQREDVELVVDWHAAVAVDELLHHPPIATDNVAKLSWYSAGDCLAPRTVEIAMAEALAVAQEIN